MARGTTSYKEEPLYIWYPVDVDFLNFITLHKSVGAWGGVVVKALRY